MSKFLANVHSIVSSMAESAGTVPADMSTLEGLKSGLAALRRSGKMIDAATLQAKSTSAHAWGLALVAFLKSNPKVRQSEVADGLGVHESKVSRVKGCMSKWSALPTTTQDQAAFLRDFYANASRAGKGPDILSRAKWLGREAARKGIALDDIMAALEDGFTTPAPTVPASTLTPRKSQPATVAAAHVVSTPATPAKRAAKRVSAALAEVQRAANATPEPTPAIDPALVQAIAAALKSMGK